MGAIASKVSSDRNFQTISIETPLSSSSDLDSECCHEECPICLETPTNLTVIVGCNHAFCYECIYNWMKHCYKLSSERACPLCRQGIDSIQHSHSLDFSNFQTQVIDAKFVARLGGPGSWTFELESADSDHSDEDEDREENTDTDTDSDEGEESEENSDEE